MSVDEMSADEMSVDEMSVDEMSLYETFTQIVAIPEKVVTFLNSKCHLNITLFSCFIEKL